MLVHGWPGSGKTTLARALAPRLGLPVLGKDDVKHALAAALGPPRDLDESRLHGRAAVQVLIAVARAQSGAVLDSTWYPYALPLVRDLPGSAVEVLCRLERDTARARWRARAAADPSPFDDVRTEAELWGSPVEPLGIGPTVEVDTVGPVNVGAVASRVRALLSTDSGSASRVH